VTLVGTQLGQTLVAGGRSGVVLGTSLGSMAALAGVVQTPGVSQFFGCTPLGPVAWATAAAARWRRPSRSKIVDLTRRRLGEQELTVARAAIGNRVTFASSMLEGRSVLELSPKSMAAAEIRMLVQEIGARL
jgi:hypothetical protein